MKIAILSMQRVVNYGSVLQAWSLKKMVETITGQRVEFLDIEDQPALPTAEKASEDYASVADYPPGLCQKVKRKVISRLSACNKKKIRRFMEKELQLNRETKNQKFDWVIVGSDEVFNHAKGVRLQLHGQIPQGKNAFTYAASCGSASAENIAPEDRAAVSAALARFHGLSVRDEATAQYIRALTDREPISHLDPVLVGDLGDRPHKRVGIQKYLLVYAYGQRIRTREEIEAIRSYGKKHKLKTVAVGGSQFWCDYYIPADPFRMLDYFCYADCVVTDTFHGAVFSVLHNKRFAVIPRPSNRNKITGLLQTLNLQTRQVENMGKLEEVLEEEVDYAPVNRLLQQEKERTYRYLKQQLGV